MTIRLRLLTAMALTSWMATGARAAVSDKLSELLSAIPPSAVESGILHDRVLSMVDLSRFDGSATAPPATVSEWRQAYFEMSHAAYSPDGWPTLDELSAARDERFEIAVLDLSYQKLRSDALASGALIAQGQRLALGTGDPFDTASLFTATSLRDRTYQGEEVLFTLPARSFVTNRAETPARVELDFDDGRGYRTASFERGIRVSYATTGEKAIRLRLTDSSGAVRHASFVFDVQRLGTPAPHDTLHITAAIPYGGQVGTARAYVYLAEGHTELTNPVIAVEGFDLDNSLDWDDLYVLLNQENLLEDLRADGYDAVVVDFTDAVTFVQRNAFTIVELLNQVDAMVEPGTTVTLAGASMGGLCSRYALAYMEHNGIEHHVRTFVSFDAPQDGANIPLGVQYWLYFFADQAAEAAQLLAILNQPAARQMLAYHYTDPPTATGSPDALRDQLENELANLGNYPSQPRLVAVANGSGAQANQGFNAGAQIIQWTYRSLLVDIDGNVWAVPNGNLQLIFQGLIDIFLLPEESLNVNVIGTAPYDGAPGGYRNSMQQMADVPAPYGDIIALHNNHCFIPTVSALDLDTNDLFHDVADDPDPLALSPFDAIYFPTANQEHVLITPQNKGWLLEEIEETPAASPDPRPEVALLSAYPNPFGGEGHIRFSLPEAGKATLALFDAAGREVTRIADRVFPAGTQELAWSDQSIPAGVYFVRLRGDGFEQACPVVIR
jgi:hypothetical protein